MTYTVLRHLQKQPNSAARATSLVRKFSLKFLEGQRLFSQDTIQDEQSPKLAETFSNKVTSAWENRQETDFTRFSCKRLPAAIVRPWLLRVRVCRFAAFALSSIFDRLELYIEWIRKLCSLKVSSNLLKNKDFCVFSSTTWNRYTVISFYIYSLQK